MAVLRVFLAALAIVQGTKSEGPSQDAVNELRAKMEKIGTRVQGLYAAGGLLAKTKIVDRLKAWHDQFEKNIHSLDGSLATQFSSLAEAETSVKDLSKEIDNEKARLSAEATQEQESLLLGVLTTRQKAFFTEQLKLLTSKAFNALPQKDILKHIQAHGDFKTPVSQQVAEYLDAHRQKLEAPAPTPKQAAPIAQKAEHKAVAVSEHKDVAMVAPEQKSVAERKAAAGNLRKVPQQHEVGEHEKIEAEKHTEVMFSAARQGKQDKPDLAKVEQKKPQRKVAMEEQLVGID